MNCPIAYGICLGRADISGHISEDVVYHLEADAHLNRIGTKPAYISLSPPSRASRAKPVERPDAYVLSDTRRMRVASSGYKCESLSIVWLCRMLSETHCQEDVCEEPEGDRSIDCRLRVPLRHLLGDRRACEVNSSSILDRFVGRTSYFDQFLFPKSRNKLAKPKEVRSR